MGAGLLDVHAAVEAVAALDPVSQSFGAMAASGGAARTAIVTLTDLGDVSRSYTVTVEDASADGVTFSGSGSLTLAPGASRPSPSPLRRAKVRPTDTSRPRCG